MASLIAPGRWCPRPGPPVAPRAARTLAKVADADLPHLFGRFCQADAARSREIATSGLGPAIVRAIVDAHGGDVGVATNPTGGAVFWLDLPLATAG